MPAPRAAPTDGQQLAPWITAVAVSATDSTPKVSKILLVEPVGVDARRGMHGKLELPLCRVACLVGVVLIDGFYI